MLRHITITLATISILAISPLPAQTMDLGELGTFGARTAIEASKITIEQAIEIASQKIHGQAIEVSFELKNGQPMLEVEMLVGDSVVEIVLNAQTGSVVKIESSDDDEDTASMRKALETARISIPKAAEIATKEYPQGKVAEVEFETENSRAEWLVTVALPSELRMVWIDAVSGDLAIHGTMKLVVDWAMNNPKLRVEDMKSWDVRQTNPTTELATWKIIDDPTSPSRNKVMALTKTQNYNGTFNLAVLKEFVGQDMELSLNAKAVSGKEDQGGGPLWRYQDENNYYVCRFNPLESNFRVYKVVDGKRKQLNSVTVSTKTGHWYQIRVTMEDNEIACHLDVKEVTDSENEAEVIKTFTLKVKDSSIRKAGRIGLWTKADAVTSFDDFKATCHID